MNYENSYWYPENKEHYEHIVYVLEKEGFRKSKYMGDWTIGDAISTGHAFFHTNNISNQDTNRTNDPEFIYYTQEDLVDCKYNVGERVVFSTKVPNPEYHGSIGVIKDVNGAYATVQIYNEKLDSIDWYTVKELDEYLVKENVEKELDNTSKPDVSLDTAETKGEFISVNKEDPTKLDIKAGRIFKLADALDYGWAEPVEGTYNDLGTTTGRITSKKTLKELI